MGPATKLADPAQPALLFYFLILKVETGHLGIQDFNLSCIQNLLMKDRQLPDGFKIQRIYAHEICFEENNVCVYLAFFVYME